MKENERKWEKKKENVRKWEKMKEKTKRKKKKRGPKGVAQKIDFLHKSLVRKSWGNWGPKTIRFWALDKEKEKERKKDKENERKWKKIQIKKKKKENERKWKKMNENERKWKKMKENVNLGFRVKLKSLPPPGRFGFRV